MALGQVALELGDGGVGVGQLLPDGQRLLYASSASAGFSVRSAQPRWCCGSRPGRTGPRRSGLRLQPLGEVPCSSQRRQPPVVTRVRSAGPTVRRLRATSSRVSTSAPGSAASSRRNASALRWTASASCFEPILSVSSPSWKIRRRQRLPRLRRRSARPAASPGRHRSRPPLSAAWSAAP